MDKLIHFNSYKEFRKCSKVDDQSCFMDVFIFDALQLANSHVIGLKVKMPQYIL